MLEREDGISIGRKEKYNNDLIDLYQLLKIRKIQGLDRSDSALEEWKNATMT